MYMHTYVRIYMYMYLAYISSRKQHSYKLQDTQYTRAHTHLANTVHVGQF